MKNPWAPVSGFVNGGVLNFHACAPVEVSVTFLLCAFWVKLPAELGWFFCGSAAGSPQERVGRSAGWVRPGALALKGAWRQGGAPGFGDFGGIHPEVRTRGFHPAKGVGTAGVDTQRA